MKRKKRLSLSNVDRSNLYLGTTSNSRSELIKRGSENRNLTFQTDFVEERVREIKHRVKIQKSSFSARIDL